MIKNIAVMTIAILIILCLAEGFYIFKLRHDRKNIRRFTTQIKQQSMPSDTAKRPAFLIPGMKFSDSPLFSKAYKIVPGDLSDDAKKALIGWNVKQTTLPDGSIQANLIPQETEDIQQQFIIKPGYSLYFIELNLADDTTQKDNNRGDDMGILVDQNGIVQ